MILTVRDVFSDCQKSIQSHRKLVQKLCKVYETTPLGEFWDTFLRHMQYCLIVFKREPAVDRTVNFIVQFATSLSLESRAKKKIENEANDEKEEEEMDPFLLKLFNFLLKHHGANDQAVRFRCCQIINKLLASLGDDYELDEDLYDEIFEAMLTRLKDKYPTVRTQAVLALTRLQDPQNKECLVISSYMFLLGCDPSPDVRRAVLSAIAATTKTLGSILERTKDVKELVRKLAYQMIAEKIDIRALTIAQRVSLLREGLNDRSDMVKEACTSRLLQSWLSRYQGNILELLKYLDVENTLETSEQMLKAFFDKSPIHELLENFDVLNQELTIPLEELSCESVLYWKSLCSFVKAAGVDAEEQLDKILPTGTVLAGYIQRLSEHMEAETNLEAKFQNDFIMQQILEVAALLDFSDEVGRKEIGQVMKSLLLSELISCTLVKPIVAVFSLIRTDPNQRITALAEIISDIREPISTEEDRKQSELLRQTELKIASICVELNQLKEELENCVEMQKFGEAAEIKAKVTELQTTKQTLMEKSLPTTVFEVRVEKNDPLTVLKCLTIVCEMLELPETMKLTPVLQTLMEVLVVQIDQEAVKITALKVIFDFLHMFGLEAFESSDIRTVCAEGLAKLMLSGRLVSSKVMSRLILLWYNPVTEDDTRLRHCLGAFFPVYAFSGRANMDVIEEAFLPTLNTLFNAPVTSPLSKVDVSNTAELLTQLTCTRHLVNKQLADHLQENTPHDNLAVRLSNEILSEPDSFGLPVLCKILRLLELTKGNVSLLKDVTVLSNRMLKEVKDRRCNRVLQKFYRITTDMLTESLDVFHRTSENNLSTSKDAAEETEDGLRKTQVDELDKNDDQKQAGCEEDEILPEAEDKTLEGSSGHGNIMMYLILNTSAAHSEVTQQDVTLSSANSEERDEDVSMNESSSQVTRCLRSGKRCIATLTKQGYVKKQATKPASASAKPGTGRSVRSTRRRQHSSSNKTDEPLAETPRKKLDICPSESDSEKSNEDDSAGIVEKRAT
ncbi:hypothetical protein LSH36_852g00004, partial [Paralvinella palmiformis]